MENIIEQIRLAENLFFGGEKIPVKIFSKEQQKSVQEFYNKAELIKVNNQFVRTVYNLFLSRKIIKRNISKRQYEYVRLKRLLTVADILMGFEARKSSIKIYEKCYKVAKSHQFDWAILHCSRWLYSHYAYYEKNINKSKRTYSEFLKAKLLVDHEINCEYHFTQLIHYFSKSKNHSSEIKGKVSNAFEELKIVPCTEQSILFKRYFLMIGIMYFELKYDLKSLTKFLSEKLVEFESTELRLTSDLNMVCKYLCEYSLRNENHETFLETLEKGIGYTTPKSVSWFRYQELHALYLIRVKEYRKAQISLLELTKMKAFGSLHSDIISRIVLKLLYCTIYLLFKNENIDSNLKILNKYKDQIQNIPEYKSDKKAMNLCLIIFQLLVYIWKRNFDMLEIRFEATDKYLRRYVKSSPLFRTYSFLKILLSLRRYDYVVLGAERSYRKYFSSLRSLPYKSSPHPGEIEIIYYENLVEVIEVYLSNKKLVSM